jgi:hypothetical protein
VNLHGRTGPGNRAGHDRRKPIRPKYKQTLPEFTKKTIRRWQALKLPLTLDFYQVRSERDEAIKAVGTVYFATTDLLTGIIGRPSRDVRRRWDGLTVDYDIAPRSGISESRCERVNSTVKDWGWLHWTAVEPGGRPKPKRGVYRFSSQPIDEKENGERRGRAAIRVWTDEVYKVMGLYAELCFIRKKISDAIAARKNCRAGINQMPVSPLVVALVESLSVPGTQRGPPE